MRTIRITATISEDRRLVLQLPPDVTPGEHRVLVVLDEPVGVEESVAETPLRWDDVLLVYDGEAERPVENTVDALREERMRHILAGYQP